MKTKADVVRAVLTVRDNLNAIGRHACPGFDCAVCQHGNNVEVLDGVIASVQSLPDGVATAKNR